LDCAAWPLAGRAQQPDRVRRIGVLMQIAAQRSTPYYASGGVNLKKRGDRGLASRPSTAVEIEKNLREVAVGSTDSPYAWFRLAAAVVIGTIGCIGMWSAVVALPAVQAEFGVDRANASLAFTLVMIGFAFGGVMMGRLSDQFGIVLPVVGGAVTLAVGYIVAGFSATLWHFTIAYGIIGLGSSAAFAPLMADISHWFTRRRGVAVAIVSSGSYLAGTIWPPIVQYFIATAGWRQTHIGIGVSCIVTMLPLTFLALTRRAQMNESTAVGANTVGAQRTLALSPNALQTLLMIAGVSCCVTMATPQIQIVAYCGDLGYGTARGAEMLSLMLGLGVVSRLVCGFVADRIGSLKTLFLASSLQAVTMLPFTTFDGLVSLYLISGAYGVFQGGIIPMYAIIVRDYFSPHEAGARVGIVVGATQLGMALGGWMSGAIFDLSGSYPATFVNAFVWNLLNLSIVLWLLSRPSGSPIDA
jgi:MFS family permease